PRRAPSEDGRVTQTPARERAADAAVARGARDPGAARVADKDEDEADDGGRSRATVLVADLRSELASAIEGAPRWLTGAAAGVQAALLSLVVVVVPVLAAYVAGSAEATGSDVGWLRAAALGTDFWLLAHGVPLGTATGPTSTAPAGLRALAAFCAFASARRSGPPSRAGLVGSLSAYVLTTLGVAALALPRGLDDGPATTRVLLGAAL